MIQEFDMCVHVSDTGYFTIVSMACEFSLRKTQSFIQSNLAEVKAFRAERESVRSVKENMSVLYIIHFWMVPLFWELFLVMCEIVWYRGVVCPYRSTSHNASVRRLNSWSRVCGETLMLCVPVWGSALCVSGVCVCLLLLFSPLFFFFCQKCEKCVMLRFMCDF